MPAEMRGLKPEATSRKIALWILESFVKDDLLRKNGSYNAICTNNRNLQDCLTVKLQSAYNFPSAAVGHSLFESMRLEMRWEMQTDNHMYALMFFPPWYILITCSSSSSSNILDNQDSERQPRFRYTQALKDIQWTFYIFFFDDRFHHVIYENMKLFVLPSPSCEID